MDRRNFLDLSVKGFSLASLASFNPFSIGQVMAEEEFKWPHEQFKYELGDFTLKNGTVLKDAFLLVDAHGTLNKDKSNVIVYPTCYAGNHYLNRGSLGLDRAMDPSKYFIIIPNMIGCGQSSSPSNTASSQDGPRFPDVSYWDNIEAQYRLLKTYYGIDNTLMYVGFSMGGQQAFHWGVMHGDTTGAIVSVAGTAKTTTHNWLFLEGCKKALQADINFNGGDYTSPPEVGLSAFATVYASWFYDQTGYREGLHLKTFGGMPDTAAFLEFAVGHFSSFDANDLLAMMQTWQYGDIGNHEKFRGDWKKAIRSINCPALIMPSETDLYFPPEDNIIEVSHMKNAELKIIPSKRGHLGGAMVPGLCPEESVFCDNEMKKLLKKIS